MYCVRNAHREGPLHHCTTEIALLVLYMYCVKNWAMLVVYMNCSKVRTGRGNCINAQLKSCFTYVIHVLRQKLCYTCGTCTASEMRTGKGHCSSGTGENTHGLHTTYYILHTTYYILHTAYCTLHTTYCILHTTYYILHTTYYILHTTYHTPHTTYHIPHTTYHIPHTACTMRGKRKKKKLRRQWKPLPTLTKQKEPLWYRVP